MQAILPLDFPFSQINWTPTYKKTTTEKMSYKYQLGDTMQIQLFQYFIYYKTDERESPQEA